jgi:hypothetical protein
MVSDRFANRLKELALLSCPISDAAVDERSVRLVLDRSSDAHRLKRAVSGWSHHAQDFAATITYEGTHPTTATG